MDGDGREDEAREEVDENVDLRDPWDGPASENAYPEDMMIEIDGKEVSMNEASRAYNRSAGQVDNAAHIPWTPENAKSPEGSAQPWRSEEEIARSETLEAEWDARYERYEQSKLESASELPDLDGEDLEITWDFEPAGEEGDDGSTILRHGDRIIWREISMAGRSRGRGDLPLRRDPLDPAGEVRPEARRAESDPRGTASAEGHRLLRQDLHRESQPRAPGEARATRRDKDHRGRRRRCRQAEARAGSWKSWPPPSERWAPSTAPAAGPATRPRAAQSRGAAGSRYSAPSAGGRSTTSTATSSRCRRDPLYGRVLASTATGIRTLFAPKRFQYGTSCPSVSKGTGLLVHGRYLRIWPRFSNDCPSDCPFQGSLFRRADRDRNR